MPATASPSTTEQCTERCSSSSPPTPPSANPLSLHDALPISGRHALQAGDEGQLDRLGGLVAGIGARRSEEHTSELQSRFDLVCRLLLEKKNGIHAGESESIHNRSVH